MKIIKILFTLCILLGGIGVGVYYFGTNIASDKVLTVITEQLESSGQIEELKEQIANDPNLTEFVEAGANVDESQLPFTTKEQATRALVSKFSVSEISEIQEKVTGGLTSEAKQELLQMVESKLTEEEILALKVIAYKELNK